MGPNLGTRETTLWRTDAEPPQSCSKGLLAGDQRFSEGIDERRDADLSVTTTLYYSTFKAQPFDQPQQNQDGQRFGSER